MAHLSKGTDVSLWRAFLVTSEVHSYLYNTSQTNQERDINTDCPEAEAEAKTSRKQKLSCGGCGEQG